jgi:hypothetical protein
MRSQLELGQTKSPKGEKIKNHAEVGNVKPETSGQS